MPTASPTAPLTLDFLAEFTPRYEAAWNGMPPRWTPA